MKQIMDRMYSIVQFKNYTMEIRNMLENLEFILKIIEMHKLIFFLLSAKHNLKKTNQYITKLQQIK